MFKKNEHGKENKKGTSGNAKREFRLKEQQIRITKITITKRRPVQQRVYPMFRYNQTHKNGSG